MRILAIAAAIIVLNALPVIGQRTKPAKPSVGDASCVIGGLRFRCPDGFVPEGAIDSRTGLFRGKGEGSNLRVFVSLPVDGFDETLVRARVARSLFPDSTREFEWRKMESLLMNIDSKYASGNFVSLGFDGISIVNFVRREFKVGEQRIVVGYGYVFKQSATAADFGEALGGDSAIGCNEIATVVNSITRERKDERQYCFLTGLTGRRL
jgi:hypothetical protein